MARMVARYAGKCFKCKAYFPAGTVINWDNATRIASHGDECPAVVAPVLAAPVVETKLVKIIDFLLGARERGLKKPTFRLMFLDGRSELRMKLADGHARIPNSLYLTVNGHYIGALRPDGTVSGAIQNQPLLLAYLNNVADDPMKAAKSYAAVSGRCMFCGLHLDDDGSVEVGYGPICAKRYNLPWQGKGVRNVEQAPLPGRFDLIEKPAQAASRFDMIESGNDEAPAFSVNLERMTRFESIINPVK